jgi:UDP-N-acetylmuramoyl-L-alanyl-D-glutamate--2,6-diaminopimelate ligase
MPVTLRALLDNLPATELIAITGDEAMMVTAPVVEAVDEVQPGGVFVAREGRSFDGHDFIPAAVERGAAAIIGQHALGTMPAPYVQVRDPQAVLGLLAAAYHGFPSRRLVVIGVTGTDGKTTTSTLIHSILKSATAGRAGYISTLAADLGGSTADTGLHVTTPTAPQVQGYLAQMVANGLTHCVLEMTSHGLAQGRLNGVELDAAVLTNVTHEHLDYHGTFEEYRAAKALMFQLLTANTRKAPAASFPPRTSIINADDPSAQYFAAIPADRVITYGLGERADFRAGEIVHRPDATQFVVDPGGDIAPWPVTTSLLGDFNVMNALAAVTLAWSLGIRPDTITLGIENVTAISGRMERIDEGQDFTAIVDFAHTPNALKNALEASRAMLPAGRRLICVFGSAGLRDVEKRRLMAETSARLADFTILTAEDPRTESLDAILEMMAAGCRAEGGIEGETFIRVPDRGEALYRACQLARTGDIVIACGKGHEQSMCFGTVEYPWDDREALRAALRGAPLRTLPTAPD